MRHSALLFILLVASSGHWTQAGSGNEPPNIIFLLTDDQTIGAVGCYGNKDVITPNLDLLARQGVRFLNHYSLPTSASTASRWTRQNEDGARHPHGHTLPLSSQESDDLIEIDPGQLAWPVNQIGRPETSPRSFLSLSLVPLPAAAGRGKERVFRTGLSLSI